MKKTPPFVAVVAAGILTLHAQVDPPPPAAIPLPASPGVAEAQDSSPAPVTPPPVGAAPLPAAPRPPVAPAAVAPVPINSFGRLEDPAEPVPLPPPLQGDPDFRARGFVFKTAEIGTRVVAFDRLDQTGADQMTEDLKILGFILNKNLERNLGEGAGDPNVYKMGVPMLLGSGGNPVQASYIEGFGVLVRLQVPFALSGPPQPEPKSEASKTDSEWERARQALDGQSPAGGAGGSSSQPETSRYNPKLVELLKKWVIESLKNTSNFRHMPPEEYVAVEMAGSSNLQTVRRGGMGQGGGFGATPETIGGGSAPAPEPVQRSYSASFLKRYHLQIPAPARTTMMTIRIKKGDADALAAKAISGEEFERKAEVRAYLGGTAGPSPLRRDDFNPSFVR